jgi:hypothetical protein
VQKLLAVALQQPVADCCSGFSGSRDRPPRWGFFRLCYSPTRGLRAPEGAFILFHAAAGTAPSAPVRGVAA